MSEARHGNQPWPQEPTKDHPGEPDWGTPPPKKRLSTNRRWALAAAIALIAWAVIGAIPDDDQAEAVTPTVTAPASVLITLDGEQVVTADITLRVGNDTTQQGIDVPMTNANTGQPGMSFTVAAGTFVYFSAQMDSEYGELTCALTSNGHPVATSHTDVNYGIVTCSGMV